jgi:hypothetical protein
MKALHFRRGHARSARPSARPTCWFRVNLRMCLSDFACVIVTGSERPEHPAYRVLHRSESVEGRAHAADGYGWKMR